MNVWLYEYNDGHDHHETLIFEFDGCFFGYDGQVYNFNRKGLCRTIENFTKLGAF